MFSIDRISELQNRISDIQTKLNLPGVMPGLSFNSYLEKAMKSAEANAMQINTESIPQVTKSAQSTQSPQQNQKPVTPAQNVYINVNDDKLNSKVLADVVSVDPKTNRLVIDIEKLKMMVADENEVEEDFEEYEENLPVSNHNIDEMIRTAAERYGVNPRLVAAIAEAESNGNQYAISSAGAIGVMQLMPGTAAALGVNPYDAEENIDGGAKYISQMLDTFNGDVRQAVAAYNAGPGAVKKYGGIPPYAETQNYVRKVIDLYQ